VLLSSGLILPSGKYLELLTHSQVKYNMKNFYFYQTDVFAECTNGDLYLYSFLLQDAILIPLQRMKIQLSAVQLVEN